MTKMTKLDQLALALTRHGRLNRTYNAMPADQTYRMDFECSINVSIWNGPTAPTLGLLPTHYWFDGTAFQKWNGENWVAVDEYDSFFPTTLLFAGDLFDQITRFVTDVAIAGPRMIPANRNHLVYSMVATWSDGAKEVVSATWSLAPKLTADVLPSGCGVVTANNGKGNVSSGSPSLDRRVVLTATHGSHVASLDLTIAGTRVDMLGQAAVRLIGPLNIMEDTATTLTAQIVFPDGTVETPSPSDFTWSVFPTALGLISATGSFTAANVAVDTQVQIRAVYTPSGNPRPDVQAATRTIAIRESTLTVSSAPFFGVGDPGQATADFLQSLPGRGTAGTRRCNFQVTAATGKKVYYAYPASLGVALFTNTTINISGGFDVGVDSVTLLPRIVAVPTNNGGTVDFYLYESNSIGMGTVSFVVT